MYHVAILSDAVKRALRNATMQSGGLLVDQPVVFAGNDDDRFFGVMIFIWTSGHLFCA